jgi:hypothetical protein
VASKEVDPQMKPSGWLFLVGAAFAVVGLVAFWPALLVVPFISFGAWKQRAAEKDAAIRARYGHTRK